MKKLNQKQSVYNNFLQTVSQSPYGEIEKALDEIKRDFPILLLDSFFPVAIYIINFKDGSYPYISKSAETVFGYKPEIFYQEGVRFFPTKIHPDDLPIVTNQLMKVLLQKVNMLPRETLSQYRFSFNCRFERGDGKFIHMLQQMSIAQVDENGDMVLSIGVCSDISFLKKDNSISLHFSKYDSKKEKFKESTVLFSTASSPLSDRESQVLKSLAEQMTNEEIARSLSISIYTVKAHRRNILSHLKCKKMNSAIATALQHGWI